ncbi:tetratricopeptide repeat protein [Novosphingobium sp. YJ-S2-02]|uniref:Tetratricopeptide repeat protein n=1 Tax=Novosphingobium aureum TaxID=2792964 RepID=A0A931HBV4_9SPHN|nr:tetratricopeptide repeat protein [Novosphingobium aureum]MBH0112952.1 tetratricopeptide repeat protein [Novosphingobium aureum]
MTWIVIAVLALLVFLLAIFLFKVPAGAREALAATLLLGIAGYALQGSPGQVGSPKAAAPDSPEASALLVDARAQISNSTIPPTNRWVIIADGLSRNGQNAAAAQILRSAVDEDPKNAEAWLAMANGLVAHADGTLTPAARYAYERAAKADDKAPGPPFFLGLAQAQSGEFLEARKLWAGLLEDAKPDARWRPVVEAELARLDAFIEANGMRGEAAPTPAGAGGAAGADKMSGANEVTPSVAGPATGPSRGEGGS